MAKGDKQSQGARDRAAIARDLRRQDRERIAGLRKRLRDARKAKTLAVKQIRSTCSAALGELRFERRELLKKAAAISVRIKEERARCGEYITAAQAKGIARLEAEQAALDQALRERATERVWTSPIMLRARGAKAARVARAEHARERRSESDSAVEANISNELMPVWNKVKRGIRGTDRMTRTEAFLHWVHDHPQAVYELQEAARERELRELEAAHNRAQREARRADRYRRHPARMAADLEEIPF